MKNRKSWLIAFFLLLVVTGLGYWATSYMAMRAALSRELALFKQVHTGLVIYQRDTGHFPATLEATDLKPYFTNLREQDWIFLRDRSLTYSTPPMNADPGFNILRVSTPWGMVFGRADGNTTYGWERQPK